MNAVFVSHAVACVVVPLIWGVMVVRISDHIENAVKRRGLKRGQNPEETAMPALDYHI